MNRRRTLIAGAALIVLSGAGFGAEVDWSKVDQAVGRKGTDQAGGVRKYSFPRSDLKVTVDRVTIKPALALGGWVAFLPTSDGAMFMGDLVLTDTEISPVMQRLITDGLEISAIHNHLIRTSVPVLYMHVMGHGDPVKLGRTLHEALSLTKMPMTASPPAPPAPLDLDTAGIEKTLGY